MKLSGLVLVTAAVALALLPACAEDDQDLEVGGGSSAATTRMPARFDRSSVNVDQSFANTARVEETRIVVPTAQNRATIARIKVGSIIAGNRDMRTTNLAKSKNPYGFLRRVTAIQVEDPTTVIETVRAELSDWISDGDLVFSDKTSVFPDANYDATALDIQPLDNNGSGGSGSGTSSIDISMEGDLFDAADGFRVKPYVKIANSNVTLNAKHDGYFRIRKSRWFPKGAEYRSHLVLDPVVRADITAGVVLATHERIAERKISANVSWERSWRVNTVPIPLGGPIPVTLRFSPEVSCKITAEGAALATVHTEAKAHAAVGFEGRASLSKFDYTDLSETPSSQWSFKLIGVEGRAGVEAECAVYAVASVMLFDTAGIEGKVGPRIELHADACGSYNVNTKKFDGDFRLYEQHMLALDFGARVQLPFLGTGKSFRLKRFNLLNTPPNYFLGDEEMCSL